ncbi:T9SS type A sorting domain-containing protein [candidate division GN15 bacterium]|nr:T9SS type A sorting domain-containing protein [candidate division GN15 bacterium]
MSRLNLVSRISAIAVVLSLLAIQPLVAIDRQGGEAANRPVSLTSQPCRDAGSRGPEDLPLNWPVCAGVLQTDSLVTSFTSMGTFGLTGGFPCGGECDSLPWPCASFETPVGSGAEYLFQGALWVGGVVGRDTLVSVGADGWQRAHEMFPPEYPSSPLGSIRPYDFPWGVGLNGECLDTTTVGVAYDYFGRPHIPLGIKVVISGFVSDRAIDQNVVIYDVTLSSIGNARIADCHFGVLIDGDVLHSAYNPGIGAGDDIAGFLGSAGVAYIIDNDGDPIGGQYIEGSVPKAIGAKMHEVSISLPPPSFNWWVSNAQWFRDYGPMRTDEYRDFLTGGLGTPEGDVNKYYMLSRTSSDFDQVFVRQMTPGNPDWILPLPGIAEQIADGGDVKFLLSRGPFDLEPGESVRFLFSLFTADSVHHDPGNAMANLLGGNYDPEQYVANLNLDHLISSAQIADQLASRVISPLYPPRGFAIADRTADGVKITWTPWVFPSVKAYELSVGEIESAEDFPHPGAVPPWYVPDMEITHVVPASEQQYLLKDIDPAVGYAFRLAHRSNRGTGAPTAPVYLDEEIREPSPVLSGDPYVMLDESTRIEWSVESNAPIDHFNIYRSPDSGTFDWPYHAFYDQGEASETVDPVDSFLVDGERYYFYAATPYAQVDGDSRSFVDPSPLPIGTYIVAAVNSRGFESHYSNQTTITTQFDSDRDVLVFTSGSHFGNVTSYDSILAFYDRTLEGLDYTIYNMYDNWLNPCSTFYTDACIDPLELVRYRLVIIDDQEFPFLSYSLHPYLGSFEHVVRSGRPVALFGSLHSLLQDQLGEVLVSLPPGWRRIEHEWARGFGIDSMFFVGTHYCNPDFPCSDSLLGFERAVPAIDGIPPLNLSLTSPPWNLALPRFWNPATPPMVEAYRLLPRPDTAQSAFYNPLYTFGARYETSLVEGEPVGVRWIDTDSTLRYAFGFHLYAMNSDQSRELIDWLLADEIGHNVGAPRVVAEPPMPTAVSLGANYPNPFNPSTTISFSLSAAGQARLEVFNILGQRVRTLVDGPHGAGVHSVVWDGRNNAGETVSSGVYFYRLTTDDVIESKKMLLLK